MKTNHCYFILSVILIYDHTLLCELERGGEEHTWFSSLRSQYVRDVEMSCFPSWHE